MLVKTEEIQGKGLERTEAIARKVLDDALSASEGFALVEASPLAATFTRVSGQVHVSGGFTATLKAPCKRCLGEVTVALPVQFALRMIPERRPRHVDEGELPPSARPEDDGRALHAGTFELDEVDAEPFDGKTIDLDPVVREQVLLALPVSVLCREDCKGLCGTCGQDLNEKDCGHGRERPVDPRLAKLKDLKLN